MRINLSEDEIRFHSQTFKSINIFNLEVEVEFIDDFLYQISVMFHRHDHEADEENDVSIKTELNFSLDAHSFRSVANVCAREILEEDRTTKDFEDDLKHFRFNDDDEINDALRKAMNDDDEKIMLESAERAAFSEQIIKRLQLQLDLFESASRSREVKKDVCDRDEKRLRDENEEKKLEEEEIRDVRERRRRDRRKIA